LRWWWRRGRGGGADIICGIASAIAAACDATARHDIHTKMRNLEEAKHFKKWDEEFRRVEGYNDVDTSILRKPRIQ
jgi:hypothetical protein